MGGKDRRGRWEEEKKKNPWAENKFQGELLFPAQVSTLNIACAV